MRCYGIDHRVHRRIGEVPAQGRPWRFSGCVPASRSLTSAYYPGAKPIHLNCSFARRTAAFWVRRQWVRRRRATNRHHRDGDPDGAPRSTILAEAELLLCPAIRRGQGPGEPWRHESRRTPATKIASAGWSEIDRRRRVDSRRAESFEWHAGHFERAVHIPLGQLATGWRAAQGPPILVTARLGFAPTLPCASCASRGFDARNLAAGGPPGAMRGRCGSARAYLAEPRAVPPEPTG